MKVVKYISMAVVLIISGGITFGDILPVGPGDEYETITQALLVA